MAWCPKGPGGCGMVKVKSDGENLVKDQPWVNFKRSVSVKGVELR